LAFIAGSSHRLNLVSNGADEKGCKGTTWTASCRLGDRFWPHQFWSLLSEYKLWLLIFLADGY
jgi:hypothetical protein